MATSGATAVEFAILGPIFFALIGATMETAVVYFAGQALDSAVQDTSRIVRTGQAQPLGADGFRSEVCDRLYGIFDCDEIHLTVTPISDFSDYSAENPMDPNTGDLSGPETYDVGAGSSVMKIEAYYKWPTILNIPGLMVGLTPDGKRLLSAVRVFRNEPF
ncbi:TadE family protein [Pelagibacterium xiamenense]|uniref:TadE family protein n=1 Tax=Pelagibacterium xiamenense TaxID=2901140 RepID=UPI001E449ED8|nr:TadE family protein [Pelagibacterium xiamenense]MCD7058865.1 pilus assembly protein [Pelagibacterium xiamenense]